MLSSDVSKLLPIILIESKEDVVTLGPLLHQVFKSSHELMTLLQILSCTSNKANELPKNNHVGTHRETVGFLWVKSLAVASNTSLKS